MDLGILLAFVVLFASMLLVCAYRLFRVVWAEEQADRARERERALRERAARSRLAEALDPKLLGAFSDLVTYADAMLERDADAKVERDADVKLERDAAARGSAPSSPSAAKGLVTLADVTVGGAKLPRDDESCVGDDGCSQEDGAIVVVDIRGEDSGAGSECRSRKAECQPGCELTSAEPNRTSPGEGEVEGGKAEAIERTPAPPATSDGMAASCDQKNWGTEDGSSAVQGEEAAAAEGTESQEESRLCADSRVLPSSDALSKCSSPAIAERQGPKPAVMLAGQTEFAAVAGSGGTGSASEVAIPLIPVTAAECSVCLVEFEDDNMLRCMHCCRHLFHQDCLEKWLEYSLSCPVCRVKRQNHLQQILLLYLHRFTGQV
ncbi:unnamed protein product [Closterium sp. NIES-53]